jgi:hypothetical protein
MWGLDSVVGLTAWFLSWFSVWHFHQQLLPTSAIVVLLSSTPPPPPPPPISPEPDPAASALLFLPPLPPPPPPPLSLIHPDLYLSASSRVLLSSSLTSRTRSVARHSIRPLRRADLIREADASASTSSRQLSVDSSLRRRSRT